MEKKIRDVDENNVLHSCKFFYDESSESIRLRFLRGMNLSYHAMFRLLAVLLEFASQAFLQRHLFHGSAKY